MFRRDDSLSLVSRNRKPLNQKYPEIVAALRRQLAPCFITDGEIVAFKGGVSSFARLQQRTR